ncbi:hypothetical protein PN471_01920 [Aphanizomenon sp. CS-733/32]|uniref:hypothetical protein n=1 Tax=Aphanizomenon sp. CS-733/32 TaxID=3021715 RepID=UPI00232DEBB3|nr:hypothetical protein [Aphanizomenon sp. CS-733/32]MDB9307427.1 hypothetical protein [Aphanizomenon sp. CS-733/32]
MEYVTVVGSLFGDVGSAIAKRDLGIAVWDVGSAIAFEGCGGVRSRLGMWWSANAVWDVGMRSPFGMLGVRSLFGMLGVRSLLGCWGAIAKRDLGIAFTEYFQLI